MKTRLLFLAIFAYLFMLSLNAKVYVVSNVGLTFSPSEISIGVGDTINFAIGSVHDAVEVSESTWNIQGNTSNGGFSVGFGGGMVAFPTAGTYYYVCEPHASAGMKGKIIVEVPTNTVNINDVKLKLYPNPAKGKFNVEFNLERTSNIDISVCNLSGQKIFQNIIKNNPAGKQNIEIALDKYDTGIYYCIINTESETITQKVELVK